MIAYIIAVCFVLILSVSPSATSEITLDNLTQLKIVQEIVNTFAKKGDKRNRVFK